MRRMPQVMAVGVTVLFWVLSASAAWADAFEMSRQREIELGREVAAIIEKHIPVDTDPVLTAKVQRIGRRLVEVCDRRDLPYEFHVIESDEVNAFSLPGGFVYLYTGILNALPSDDAVAFLLGHELAHAAKRHYARRYQKYAKLSVFTLGYGSIASIFLQPHYSRRYEHEADYYGTLWAAKAGFAPDGGPASMRTLLDMVGPGNSGIAFLRSHPATRDRLARLESQLAKVIDIAASGRPDEPPDLSDLPEVDDIEPEFPELAAFELGPNDLWPLGPGATWVYETELADAGTMRRSVTVEEELPGAGKGVHRLRTSLGTGLDAASLIATTRAYVLTRPTVTAPGTGEPSPAEWRVEWVTDLGENETRAFGDATFVCARETVTVPVGTFDAVRIEKRDPAEDRAVAIGWFAPGVGLVKLSIPAQGLTEALISYRPPGEDP